MSALKTPVREYLIIAFSCVALGYALASLPASASVLFVVALIGSLPTFHKALQAAYAKRISIDTFNSFALLASMVAGELRSSVFIVLMLASAAILDEKTVSRSRRAIEELFALKPLRATVEQDGRLVEVAVDDVQKGDVVVVSEGSRVPVDGMIITGSATFNESSVTGESAPVSKKEGDVVMSGTRSDEGSVKIRATGVGKDSTIERMAALIRSAAENKSRAERLADRFAGIFLPIVGLVGLTGYFVTGNVNTMIAIFLVACADDMAVAIPLAITASMGQAARRGVVFKGGEWMDVAASITTVVLDKTGTLTYGERRVSEARLLPGTDPKMFWEHVAAAEKMIDQPLGRAMFNEALSHIGAASDPESFENRAGRGVVASVSGKKVVIGSETLLQEEHIALDPDAAEAAQALIHSRGVSAVYVTLDGRCAGVVGIADVPRTEAAESIAALKRLGVRIVMLTGDTEEVAAYVASTLGIDEFRARMLPEDKLREVEKLMNEHKGIIAVVGDGINDAPALARADVGIAMGTTGMAVAVEAADVVILTDNLSRLPDIITLGRRTRSVVFGDMGLWLTTNAVGFTLVFTGFVGPALAAFYNFATDFLPIMNSARLFRR